MNNLPSRKIRDVRGERFGRLLVESFSHIASHAGKNAFWKCLCDCGVYTTVDSGALRTGSTTSCGCYSKEVSRALIKKTHSNGQHLYFIRCGEYVKIGRANKIKLRLDQLRAANPFDVLLIREEENKGYLEHSLHEKFKKYLHRGEWFLLTDDQVLSCEVI